MKILILLPIILAFIFFVPQLSYEQQDNFIISTIIGSSVPGCEETTNGCFSPKEISVPEGKTIIFENADSAAHTFTSGSAANGPNRIFDSSFLMPGASYQWTANISGDIPYFCMVHPWAQGIIHVTNTNSKNIVINEVDINPPGDDSASISEWVELYNPTDSEINLGGWEIASTTVLKKTMTILAGTTIQPGEFLTYSYENVWFTDANESVELRDENGIVIDKTPLLSDLANDFTSWQRIYDGYDHDDISDWKFVTSTAGSSNGKLLSPSLKVTIEEGEDIPGVGKTINIHIFGAQQTVRIEIIAEDGEIINTLSMVPSIEGDINLPWIIPKDLVSGIYLFKVTDGIQNAETTFEIITLIEKEPIDPFTLTKSEKAIFERLIEKYQLRANELEEKGDERGEWKSQIWDDISEYIKDRIQ